MNIRTGTPQDVARAVAIWRAATDATHGFLTPEHRIEIDWLVADQFLPTAELWLAEDKDGKAVGFLAVAGRLVDALFVDPAVHGQGYGTRLLGHAVALGATLVDANEQADNALPFYLRRGFEVIGWSPTDHEGRPYPLVHLQLRGSA